MFEYFYRIVILFIIVNYSSNLNCLKEECQDVEKEAKVLEREAQNATGKSFVITSKESPNPLFVVSPVVVESSVSLGSSTKRPVVY